MATKHRDNQKIQLAERMREIVRMREMGMSYQDIATRTGIGVQTVRADIRRYTEDLPQEAANEVRLIELNRLDIMLGPNLAKAAKGDPRAVNAVIKIMDHRAKLMGLYNVEIDTGQQAVADAFKELGDSIRGAVGGAT